MRIDERYFEISVIRITSGRTGYCEVCVDFIETNTAVVVDRTTAVLMLLLVPVQKFVESIDE